MRFALLFAAVALQAAPVLYTGIADATKFHNYTQKHYGVDGHPDKLLFMFWSQSMDTVADVWLESLDGQHVSEAHFFNNPSSIKKFNINFLRSHLKRPELASEIRTVQDVIRYRPLFRLPAFVIARRQERWWKITEKVFAEEL